MGDSTVVCCVNLFTSPDEVEVTMMTSSNGKIFRVTGPFCGEFTGDRTKGQ